MFGRTATATHTTMADGACFEQERQHRIESNKERMRSLLGDVSNQQHYRNKASATARLTVPRKAAGCDVPREPARRSMRHRGREPELPASAVLFCSTSGLQSSTACDRLQEPKRPRTSTFADECDGASRHDAHNIHRLRTMSEDAMLNRISKISNISKLRSLVEVLRMHGRDELAAAAAAALEERLGGC